MKNYLGSLLLSGLFFSFNSTFSQTITKAIGNYGSDYLFDMVSHGSKNYVYGNFALNITLPQLMIGDTTFNMGCYTPSICVLDENMNLLDYTCFVDTEGYYKGSLGGYPGKIAYDPLYHHIYIAGTFFDAIVIGKDTLYSDWVLSSLFVAKFDTNLNPIWARTPLCNFYQNNLKVEISNLEIDGLGRAWISLKADQGRRLICFKGDSIHEEGTVVYDTSGNTVFPVRQPTTPLSPTPTAFFNAMDVVDQERMLVVNPSYTLMVDVPADTVIWKKSFTADLVKVDTVNKTIYMVSSTRLIKRDLMGNFLWSTPYTDSSFAMGIALTKNKDKIYVAGRTAGPYNKISVLDSAGNFLDSMTWGIYPYFGNSSLMDLQSFQIHNKKLKISYNSPSGDKVFGKDTIEMFAQEDGLLSFIDLNNILTSVHNKVMKTTTSFKIFPNPNSGTFMLEGDGEIIQLNLYNLQGKHIQAVGSAPFKEISLSEDLPEGLYFLRIKTTTKLEVVKLVLK